MAASRQRVGVAIAPMREAPRTAAVRVSEALFGEIFIVEDERDGWARGRLETDGYGGYLPAGALDEPGPPASHAVAVPASFLYPAPDLKTMPLAALALGSRVTPRGARCGGFVEIVGGGWLFAAHLRPLDDPVPDFVALAERFLGAPYLWGGRSLWGIDCSGLIHSVLRAAGIPAPRDSAEQADALGAPLAAGTPLRRGDLAFFPGHVGLMLDTERLLHANAWDMAVSIHPLAEVIRRIGEKEARPLSGRRRIP